MIAENEPTSSFLRRVVDQNFEESNCAAQAQRRREKSIPNKQVQIISAAELNIFKGACYAVFGALCRTISVLILHGFQDFGLCGDFSFQIVKA
ncbi:uncharacterized protein PRCAT00002131001 [Priceomyces carsonii]|uniref:uncharacterized protein n=1 Tax=Priceomyces carsonii TaxID=28549 RepID=UPI002EDACB03|nr:unnamed protein product [Priceomyces carsonii]